MSKIRRFVNVASRTSNIVHRMFARTMVEGNLTQCGVSVQKGWIWWVGGRYPGDKDYESIRRCRNCDKVKS